MALINLSSRGDEDVFHEKLSAIVDDPGDLVAVVGVSTQYTTSRIAVIGPPPTHSVEQLTTPTVGCFAKVLTTSLVVSTALGRSWSLDRQVRSCKGMHPKLRAALPPGLSVRHLLNHTHGLADISDAYVSYRQDGMLDCEKLAAGITRAVPVSGAGAIYSYSGTGTLVAAALLEGIYERPYPALLCALLLSRYGVQSTPQGVCPSKGGNLRLPIDALLRYCRAHFDPTTSASTGRTSHLCYAVTQPPVSLPGVAPESGAGLGWKYYEDGWIGHNGIQSGQMLVVRLNLQQGAAIIISGGASCVAALQGRLTYGQLWHPFRLKDFSTASTSSCGENCSMDWNGEYVNGGTRLRWAAHADIRVDVTFLHESGRPQTIQLRRYRHDLYISQPPTIAEFAFIQVLKDRDGTRCLWNGAKVFVSAERLPQVLQPAGAA